MTKTYYDILGIDRTATLKEIKDAYIEKSLALHPVNNPNPNPEDPTFKEISEAYQILSDPHKKYHYDHPYELKKYDFEFMNPHYLFKDFFNQGFFDELDDFEKMREDFINHDEFFKQIDDQDINLDQGQSYSK